MPRRAVQSDGRRRAINTKITDEIRAKLEAAAAVSGRTISHEIEHRLEESFLRATVSPQAAYLGDVVGLAVTFSAGIIGQAPLENRYARHYTFIRAANALALAMSVYSVAKIKDDDERKRAADAEKKAKYDENEYRAAKIRWSADFGNEVSDDFDPIDVARLFDGITHTSASVSPDYKPEKPASSKLARKPKGP